MEGIQTKIRKVRLNLGDRPTFKNDSNEHKIRSIEYSADHYVDKFPLICSENRQFDALEMNLFLVHKYKGFYRTSRKVGRSNLYGGVSVKTLHSIANSLSIFLLWLDNNNVDWRDVKAAANTERAKYWLPVYRFRKYLIDHVQSKSIKQNTANLYISHVRQFYEWVSRRGAIDTLPFEYRHIQIKQINDFNLLFSYPDKSNGLIVQTSDLTIPKKYRQKSSSNDQLAPYSKDELSLLFESDHLVYPTRRLWVDMGLLTGLRAFEIAAFSERHVVDTSNDSSNAYYALITGKGSKEREILIPRILMQRLWRYKNSPSRLSRAIKWDIHKSTNSDRPLFMNRSGSNIKGKSVSNVISNIRKELALNGIDLKRTFHDLRSTYATNLAKYMLSMELGGDFIEYKLMSLLGHSDFSTTRKYLNFARSVTFDSEMKGWSDTVFEGIDARLMKDYEHLTYGDNDE